MSKYEVVYISVVGFIALFAVLVFMAWVGNIHKLHKCDFKATYDCEVIHGVGILIAPAAILTVWYPTDK